MQRRATLKSDRTKDRAIDRTNSAYILKRCVHKNERGKKTFGKEKEKRKHERERIWILVTLYGFRLGLCSYSCCFFVPGIMAGRKFSGFAGTCQRR